MSTQSHDESDGWTDMEGLVVQGVWGWQSCSVGVSIGDRGQCGLLKFSAFEVQLFCVM